MLEWSRRPREEEERREKPEQPNVTLSYTMPADVRRRSKRYRRIPATISRTVHYREHYTPSHAWVTRQWWETDRFIPSAAPEAKPTHRQLRVVKIEGVSLTYRQSIFLLGRAPDAKFVMWLTYWCVREINLKGVNRSLNVKPRRHNCKFLVGFGMSS
jgi:hypothetical protein